MLPYGLILGLKSVSFGSLLVIIYPSSKCI
jgi:hypothetical protein